MSSRRKYLSGDLHKTETWVSQIATEIAYCAIYRQGRLWYHSGIPKNCPKRLQIVRLENTPKIRGGGKLAVLLAICCAFVLEALFAGEYSADGCSVKWTDRSLQIGNGLFSRSYIAVGDSLRTVSLKSVSGTEWQVRQYEATETGKMAVSVTNTPWSPVGVEGVRVDVAIGERNTVLHVFPGVPGVISQTPLDASIVRVHDLDRDFDGRKEWLKITDDACGRNECVYYGNRHVKVKSVVCVDQTDIRDHLVSIDERLSAKCDWAYSLAAKGLDGFLKSTSHRWTPAVDPLVDSSCLPHFPCGDSFLLYPGPRASLRWESLRDGFEDFEKIALLREKGRITPALAAALGRIDYARFLAGDTAAAQRDVDAVCAAIDDAAIVMPEESYNCKTSVDADATERVPPVSPVSHNICAVMGGPRSVAAGFAITSK